MATFILIILVLIAVYSFLKKPKEDYHSNWAQLIPGFKFSTIEFYHLVQEELSRHEVDKISFEEVSLKTGSIFSSERLYLRIRWQNFYYDLCFAPFGDGCFVSWWLIYETSSDEILLSKIPFIGEFLRNFFFRKTFYKIDTASMFMTYAHHSVLAVIDEITKDTGTRLTEMERKPILNDLFRR